MTNTLTYFIFLGIQLVLIKINRNWWVNISVLFWKFGNIKGEELSTRWLSNLLLTSASDRMDASSMDTGHKRLIYLCKYHFTFFTNLPWMCLTGLMTKYFRNWLWFDIGHIRTMWSIIKCETIKRSKQQTNKCKLCKSLKKLHFKNRRKLCK